MDEGKWDGREGREGGGGGVTVMDVDMIFNNLATSLKSLDC
jgi:hypothetical protein